MPVLTERQRAALQRRLARAICWEEATSYQRQEANRIAKCVLDEMNEAGIDGPSVRRAVVAIAERAEGRAS